MIDDGLNEMMGFVTLLHGNLMVCDLGTGVEGVDDVFFVPYTTPLVGDDWSAGTDNDLPNGFDSA